ncbi:MAG: hypothetical protein ABI602_02565 [Candidatus Saccharibacteria bacterium]
MKLNMHIEIVSSTDTGLSSMSKRSRDAVHAILAKHYKFVRVTIVNDLSDLEDLVARRPDLVFLGMKFIPVDRLLGWNDPDKIWLSQYFDENDIPYTGSGRLAHELELNKQLAKQRVIEAGLSTSPYAVVAQGDVPVLNDAYLTYPLFVKPIDRGGGLGIDERSLVYNYDELCLKVASIASLHRSDSLVERYLSGREFSVAILKDEFNDEYRAMPIELVAAPNDAGSRVLSQSIKASNTEVVTAIADAATKSKVCSLALDVFLALGARDYGRIDIRMDQFDEPYFLEANLVPSLIAGYGSFPKACVINQKLSYEAMLLAIVNLAFTRSLGDVETESLAPQLTAAVAA